jgi:murein L,D-transpeptidase YcbB/YkuD
MTFVETVFYLKSATHKTNKRLLVYKILGGAPGILGLLLLLSACGNGQKEQSTPAMGPTGYDPTIAGSFMEISAMRFDQPWLDSFFVRFPAFADQEASIRSFYERRTNCYAWHDAGGLTEQADHLFNRMLNQRREGLEDSTRYVMELVQMMAEGSAARRMPLADIMLTAQYFQYSIRHFEGVSEEMSRKTDWFLPRKKFSPEHMLDSMLTRGGYLFEHEPVFYQYRLLKKALDELSGSQFDTVRSPLPTLSRILAEGDTSAAIPAYRKRLVLTGDLERYDGREVFDTAMATAVRRFQWRHGLESDGKLSPDVCKELSVSGQERMRQILLNMERFRWIPERMEGRYLFVNIPEFKLRAYDGDSALWEMRVIVGQELRSTVIFNGEISYLVFSPYWNIPSGILERDVLPAMRRDPAYLQKHNMEITGYRAKTPVIRQRPGSTNPLGKVKFMFPNVHDIYLHDSPAKNLFEKSERAFSSGCVRVADAGKLAGFLLEGQPGWSPEKIREAMDGDQQVSVNLDRKMPVFLVYFTAWIDGSGDLHFRKDIYRRDRKLAELLFAGN